jgi:diguanylate cyclase (GGDEF)-like protein
MTFSLRSKILAMFGLLMAMSVSNFFILLDAEENAETHQFWVLHTYQVLNETKSFLGYMRDAETGQRGYLLVGEEDYLEPYNVGVERAKSTLDLLRELTSDNPIQQVRLDTALGLMAKKFAELGTTIRLQRQGDGVEALAAVRGDEGKQIMDDLRALLSEFTSEEERLLVMRHAQFAESQAFMKKMLYLEGLGMVFLIAGAAFVLQYTMVRPISRLITSARRIAEGGDVDGINTEGTDELGELARTLASMHGEIKTRVSELEDQSHFDQAFSHAVTACSSSQDLVAALSDALTVHSMYHRSPLSAVYLHDRLTNELRLEVSHGTSSDVARSISAEVGLVGQVFTTNQSLVVGASNAEGFYVDVGLGTFEPHAVVLQPINFRGDQLGVLVVVYTVDPGQRDRQYIGNLAHQFGITVAGARQYEQLQSLTSELEESRRKVIVERDEAVMQAITDPLTGLNNRGYMQIEAGRLVSTSIRHDHELSLIMLDIDHFKTINDSLGHQAGDEVLKAMGAILMRESRSGDLLIRYGGEEFVVILAETGGAGAKEAAEKLRAAVSKAEIPALAGKRISVSLGVAMLRKDSDTLDQLVARADAALYQAKDQGRDRVCIARAYNA